MLFSIGDIMMHKAKMTNKDLIRYEPVLIQIAGSKTERNIWEKGDHIGYNSGIYGWNWDLIRYRGRYYVAGYRGIPSSIPKYKSK